MKYIYPTDLTRITVFGKISKGTEMNLLKGLSLLFLVLLLSVVQYGCGSGGGGGGTPDVNWGTGSLAYTGLTSEATINEDNAIDISSGT